jgi:hypothetical protein
MATSAFTFSSSRSIGSSSVERAAVRDIRGLLDA